MNSSTGFKKRSLLRPASGILSQSREFLKVFDVSQSQPIFATNIRTEVAAIQEQINLLDKDKIIRTGQLSLDKSYVLNIKKWLKDVQIFNEKEDDDGKILKYLGVDGYEAGFRKLWRFLSHLDLLIAKITELQAVQFIKYDEYFQNISKYSANADRILQSIGKGGFNPSNFYLSQLLLCRQIELFETTTALKRQSSSSLPSKGLIKTKNQSNQLVEQLKQQNNKLMDLLSQLQQNQKKEQQLQKQKRERKQKQNYQTNKSSFPSSSQISPKDAFVQVQEKYSEQITSLNEKIKKLEHQLGQLHIHCSGLEAKLKAAQNELTSDEFKSKKAQPGTYEQALLEEMNKMKAGFEKRIKIIMQQFAAKQREMRRKEYDYKNENDRVKWEKGLLMKKFELLSAA